MKTVACLVCTNRPEWAPFVEHQTAKQVTDGFGTVRIVDPRDATIPEKRTALLREALARGDEYIAWFDDDDWSSPTRLAVAVEAMERDPLLAAVGNVRSWFISATTRKGVAYQAPEGIIFNGAVFRASTVPETFSRALTVGEDTDWLARWMRRRPNYMIVGEPMHAWLCHRRNVTNNIDSRSFMETPPRLLSNGDWSLVP